MKKKSLTEKGYKDIKVDKDKEDDFFEKVKTGEGIKKFKNL